jgi:Replication protein P
METDQNLATSSMSQRAMSADGSPIPIRWVEDLFERLRAVLGPRMADVLAGADIDRVKAEWADALASFSADEVKRGLAATRTRKFPPNLPEFLHLCRPALDPEIAWIEAEQGMASHARCERFAWSHPAVYWAGRQLSFELRSSTFAQCRKRWELLLTAEFARGAWCSPPDPTQKRIEKPSQYDAVNPLVREEALRKLRDLRQQLTGHATRHEHQAALQQTDDLAPRHEVAF